MGSVTAWVVSHRPLTVGTWVQSQASPCGICNRPDFLPVLLLSLTGSFHQLLHSQSSVTDSTEAQ